jgi:hypothetical protein
VRNLRMTSLALKEVDGRVFRKSGHRFCDQNTRNL